MTNYEKYREEVVKVINESDCIPAVIKGRPASCMINRCSECSFELSAKNSCFVQFIDWLNTECIEKPKLTQREWHLCKAIETGWIARNKRGDSLYLHKEKPRKGDEIWISYSVILVENIMPDSFSFIQWQDSEPWSVEELMKLEVEE